MVPIHTKLIALADERKDTAYLLCLSALLQKGFFNASPEIVLFGLVEQDGFSSHVLTDKTAIWFLLLCKFELIRLGKGKLG
jgi:hypothetical protein